MSSIHNSSPVSASTNLTGYVNPPAASVSMAAAPVEEKKSGSNVSSAEKVQSIGGYFNWLKKLLGFEVAAEKIEPDRSSQDSNIDSPFSRTQQDEYIQQTVKTLNDQRKYLEEDEFNRLNEENFDNLLKNFSIDRLELLVKLKSLKLQKTELVYDEQERQLIWKLANELKIQIDAALKQKHLSGDRAKLFGKIDTGMASLLLGLSIVISGTLLATAATGGVGTIPAALALTSSIATYTSVAASLAKGVASISRTLNQRESDKAKADFTKLKFQNQMSSSAVEHLITRSQQAINQQSKDYRAIAETEENKSKAKKQAFRD